MVKCGCEGCVAGVGPCLNQTEYSFKLDGIAIDESKSIPSRVYKCKQGHVVTFINHEQGPMTYHLYGKPLVENVCAVCLGEFLSAFASEKIK